MSDKFKIAIFSSGNGSNFEAIVKSNIPNVEVSFLFCNMPDAYVLERAKNLSIESIFLSHKDYDSRKSFESEIISRIKKYLPPMYHLIEVSPPPALSPGSFSTT